MPNTKSQMGPKTERTPGPWKVSILDYRTITGKPYQNKDGEWVTPAVAVVTERTGETHHNAAFIVKACNHFEEMLKALQHASMSEHHPACKAHGERSGFPERYCTCHVQKAKVVLAKIEGA